LGILLVVEKAEKMAHWRGKLKADMSVKVMAVNLAAMRVEVSVSAEVAYSVAEVVVLTENCWAEVMVHSRVEKKVGW
jgi:hypothetical protein